MPTFIATSRDTAARIGHTELYLILRNPPTITSVYSLIRNVNKYGGSVSKPGR